MQFEQLDGLAPDALLEGLPHHGWRRVDVGDAQGVDEVKFWARRLLECLGPPRIPVSGIVGVHQQIRAGLLGQAIGEFRLALARLARRGAD